MLYPIFYRPPGGSANAAPQAAVILCAARGAENARGMVIEIARTVKVEWQRDDAAMIEVTKLNGENLIVNADQIESVESHPDTALVLNNGKRIVVRDQVSEIVRKVIEYQKLIRSGSGPRAVVRNDGDEERAGKAP